MIFKCILRLGDVAPQIDRLVHHWAFEDGSGNSVIDNGTGGANLTLRHRQQQLAFLPGRWMFVV